MATNDKEEIEENINSESNNDKNNLSMNKYPNKYYIWIMIPAIFSFLLVLILLYIIINPSDLNTDSFTEFVKIPTEIVIVIILLLAISSLGLCLRQSWGRYIFLLVAPWALIKIFSASIHFNWQPEILLNGFLVFIYMPSAFILSRHDSLVFLKVTDSSWGNRGGGVLLISMLIMYLIHFLITSTPKHPFQNNLNSWYEIYNSFKLSSKNESLIFSCYMLLMNYTCGLIAVSIPTKKIIKNHIDEKAFEDYCPLCLNYDKLSGACNEIKENVRSYPKRFLKKCNGNLFNRMNDEIDEII